MPSAELARSPCCTPHQRTQNEMQLASVQKLTLTVARQLKREDVLAALVELFIARKPPTH